MKKIQKIYYTIAFFFLVTFPSFALATKNPSSRSGGVSNPIKADSIQELLTAILKIIIAIGAPISVFFIIYAGFKFVWARGNPGKLDEAKSFLLWTIIGIVVLLGAQLLATILKGTIDQLGAGI